MTDHMTQPLDELCKSVVKDGIVDRNEVRKLRERIYADRVVARAEAKLLFDINDAVSGNANDASWQQLFVDAICDHLLKNHNSPGAIDASEASWLLNSIQQDRQVDSTERALLKSLQDRATSLDAELATFISSL